jgi:NAD(P)-dependent dehydrogenase (short-subunit alcohol dehydrogenase family)
MGRLENKIAVVTGAASGMGQATAELYAKEGAHVALTDINADALAAIVESIADAGGSAEYHVMDVRDEAQVKKAVTAVGDAHGRIDILVNSAGVIGSPNPTHELSVEDWDYVFDVDVKGVFFATKYALPYMMAQKAGSIINYSSIYGLTGNDEFTAYHIAKGAVTMQTKQDAAVYGKYNIRVNSVHPSTVLTPLVQGIVDDFPGGLEEYEKVNTQMQSIRRIGRPDDVAWACVYLGSDESTWVTGVNLPIDGGFMGR